MAATEDVAMGKSLSVATASSIETTIGAREQRKSQVASLGDRRTARTGWMLFAGFTVVGFALYYATCMRGVVWQDSSAFQYRVWRMDLKGELGLALAHPLYILLAKGMALLPLGPIAFRVNLFSSVAAALALGLCARLLWELSGCVLAAVVGSIVLGVSHTFWTHAVIAEMYDLYALCLLIELSLVQKLFATRQAKWFIAAFFAWGLTLSVHDLALLHAPAYAGLIVWALRAMLSYLNTWRLLRWHIWQAQHCIYR